MNLGVCPECEGELLKRVSDVVISQPSWGNHSKSYFEKQYNHLFEMNRTIIQQQKLICCSKCSWCIRIRWWNGYFNCPFRWWPWSWVSLDGALPPLQTRQTDFKIATALQKDNVIDLKKGAADLLQVEFEPRCSLPLLSSPLAFKILRADERRNGTKNI